MTEETVDTTANAPLMDLDEGELVLVVEVRLHDDGLLRARKSHNTNHDTGVLARSTLLLESAVEQMKRSIIIPDPRFNE